VAFDEVYDRIVHNAIELSTHKIYVKKVGTFGTLVSNRADNWDSDALLAHTHDSLDVQFDTASLKPASSLVGSANIPATTVLDNGTNVAAFQIDMNTTQPSITCVYIIRAY
jgi:hypothetical protein